MQINGGHQFQEIMQMKPHLMTIPDFFRVGMDRILPELQAGPDTGIILNLGCGNARGNKAIPNAIGLQLPEWNAETDRIPFDDETVGTIHAYHFLEHVRRPIFVLSECQRILKVGGVMNIVVPYYNSSLQAQDLDHKSAWCETTWQTLFANLRTRGWKSLKFGGSR
jgi:SAM-dependent methyltransferase